jgi:chemotaxis protein methyltransferase WspC
VALARIAALLKERIGLDAESIGVTSVERAVRERLAARGLGDPQVYWQQLMASEEELQELIEAIVIPETWFFRDPEAFAALLRLVVKEWLPKHAEGTLRMLSLPCSTGEEPFSMAMALLGGGFPPQRFHIDAIDISTRAIARAERGIYGKNSFRAKDLGFRERYFEPVEAGYRLIDGVRQQVRFRHGNLLADGWLHGAHGYDVIFCRNVLIYFDRPVQDRAIEVLGRLLSPAGHLFVGPSETSLLLDHGFTSAGIPLAFAFRRADAPASQATPTRKTSSTVNPARPVPNPRPRISAPTPKLERQPRSKETLDPKPVAAPASWIEQARQLANQGNLVAALRCCERNLTDQPASAEAFYLGGLLYEAAGQLHRAAEHYRKALYLEPRHREVLVHLAVALQKEGDAHGAKRLFDRADRLLSQDESKLDG